MYTMPTKQVLTIKEASKWASDFLDRDVSESNISYLVQYGKVKKLNKETGVHVNLQDLKKYYDSSFGKREIDWKKKLGDDLNWALSFDHLREVHTTKHVHRLHPYKGKFIPQLVEYFLDSHTDDFKKEIFFKKGDIVLDPFAGSGTTLVQANELGIHSIGVDVSQFNCMISETKLLTYDFALLQDEVDKIQDAISKYESNNNLEHFEKSLHIEIAKFNNKYFPSPKYKYALEKGKVKESVYSSQKEKVFLKIYDDLVKEFAIELNNHSGKSFLQKWYMKNVRDEIDFVFDQIKKVKDANTKKILAVILSRTVRSCRATTHSDLATLKEPQVTSYYCWKHKKICKPLFSIKNWFERYTIDTIKRLKDFAKLRGKSLFVSLPADSRNVDILQIIRHKNQALYSLVKDKKIAGIFTSPPYVGQIDYHEQHAYAYDLFGFKRNDESEIGPLYKGQGIKARESYVDGIADVLNNCKKYLADNADIFLVANDKYNLYPKIAEKSGMKIVNQYKRPVLNRTERDRNPYAEIIFHFKLT